MIVMQGKEVTDVLLSSGRSLNHMVLLQEGMEAEGVRCIFELSRISPHLRLWRNAWSHHQVSMVRAHGATVPVSQTSTSMFLSVPSYARYVVYAVEEENERRRIEDLSPEERANEEREKRWVHYPLYRDINEGNEAFMQAEQALEREERSRKREEERRRLDTLPLVLDLDEPDVEEENQAGGGTMIAAGGQGGLGNPYFASATNRSPKFATRGREGERITIELELKLLADVGLVGFPNAGKSTMLRALTNSKAEVAPYAFTTLNPQVGIVRLWDDGTFDHGPGNVIEDDLAATPSQGERPTSVVDPLRTEAVRFTIADNPGLLAGASENVGLGHSFLRSIERSLALVYVVDFSKDDPWDDVEVLRMELEAYKEGLSHKARLILANKADLAVSDDGGSEDEVRVAKEKLKRLEKAAEYMVASNLVTGDRRAIQVIPVSGKYRQNLDKVVRTLASIVDEERQYGRF